MLPLVRPECLHIWILKQVLCTASIVSNLKLEFPQATQMNLYTAKITVLAQPGKIKMKITQQIAHCKLRQLFKLADELLATQSRPTARRWLNSPAESLLHPHTSQGSSSPRPILNRNHTKPKIFLFLGLRVGIENACRKIPRTRANRLSDSFQRCNSAPLRRLWKWHHPTELRSHQPN